MNREIRFRGLRVDGKGWEYGYYVHNVCYPDSHATHRIFPNGWEVDPKTLGELTGPLDKRGKEIYEGDKVKFSIKQQVGKNTVAKEYTGTVIWSDAKAGFFIMYRDYVTDEVFNQRHNEVADCEVIGNIYETPELLAHQTI